MCRRFFILVVTILFFFTGNILAQDQSVLNEMLKKVKKLFLDYENCQDPLKQDQLMKEIIELEEEMDKTAEEIARQNENKESIQSYDPATERLIEQQQELINSLSPILQKIQKLSNEISSLDDDLITNSERINAASKEILRLMGDLYLKGGTSAKDPKHLIVSLKFCKEITINYELKGRGHLPDVFELNYDIDMQLKAYWTSDYLVDVIQRKGYLHSHTIKSVNNEIYPDKIENIKFSGWGDIITGGPLTKHSYDPGTGSVIIGPSENKTVKFSDPNKWPDEIVSKYMVGYTPPFIVFSSSQNQVEGVGWPIPCATNLNNLTYITPDELNKGIREGTFSKAITKDTFFPNCDESTITLSIDFPNLLCDQHADKGALATADACIDHGGYVLATEDHVFAHGKPVARVGDHVLCLRHGITEIVGDKDVKVYSDEQRIARVGDKTKCGAIIMGGSFNVYAGER